MGEDGASGRITHWRSPFGPLLTQRYPPWCLRLYRYLFDTFIAEGYGEYGASGRIRTSDRSVRSR
ncbi:hypothetical protein, partial [Escherichia coli]|uniref:hypothetical protein n=1 Tax=Escherichia coli TaxID=562 RepID=UPI001E377448